MSNGRWLTRLEALGNRLPQPTLLFIAFCAALLPLSALLDVLGTHTQHPLSGDTVAIRSLLDAEGLRYLFTSLVSNFTGFAPVGVVLVAMLGLGIAEHAGLLSAALGGLVKRASGRGLVITVAFAGVLSSLTVDAGYVVLIPLAGTVFHLAGRSPIAGMATAFAGVSGGFSANLLVGPVDATLAGLSSEAAQIVDPSATVNASANYWFLIVSTFLVAGIVSLITLRVTEPRQAARTPSLEQTDTTATPVDTSTSKSAYAGKITALVFLALLIGVACLVIPADAPLRHPETGGLQQSPFIQGLVVIIALIAGICGAVYGRLSGQFENNADIVTAMETTMASLAGYLVLMFFAAQFVAWFNYSQIGLLLAVEGAAFLGSLTLPKVLLLLLFVLLSATINLLIGSASAKWSILAPVFIPMLMLLGISPEATQAAYRVGDSSTNIITPLMPYFVLVLGFIRRYQKDAGVGTLITLMLPYSLSLLLGWSVLLAVWISAGWSFGP